MIEIKEGDAQPVDCKQCKSRHGYQVSQKIERFYDAIYAADGSSDGGVYSDSEKVKRRYKKPCCANCHAPLPFNISA